MHFAFGIQFPTMSCRPQSVMNRKMPCSLLPSACLTDLFRGAHRQYQLFFLLAAKISQQLRRGEDYELWKITREREWQKQWEKSNKSVVPPPRWLSQISANYKETKRRTTSGQPEASETGQSLRTFPIDLTHQPARHPARLRPQSLAQTCVSLRRQITAEGAPRWKDGEWQHMFGIDSVSIRKGS